MILNNTRTDNSRIVSARLRGAARCTIIGLVVATCGCGNLDSLLSPLLPLPDPDSPEMTQPEIEPEVVTVVFRNLSTTNAVDVQFFLVQANLPNVMSELFMEENAVSRTIGVAGTGIMEPGKIDIFETPCSEALTLGTLGGSFFDNETGDPTGDGSPRWVQEPGLGLCGSVVTFEYASFGNVFTTDVTVERP